MALDMAHEMNASTEVIAVTTQILTIAVLSILITAPVGAAAIGLTGPLLLQQPSKSTSARVSPQGALAVLDIRVVESGVKYPSPTFQNFGLRLINLKGMKFSC